MREKPMRNWFCSSSPTQRRRRLPRWSDIVLRDDAVRQRVHELMEARISSARICWARDGRHCRGWLPQPPPSYFASSPRSTLLHTRSLMPHSATGSKSTKRERSTMLFEKTRSVLPSRSKRHVVDADGVAQRASSLVMTWPASKRISPVRGSATDRRASGRGCGSTGRASY